MLSLVRQWEQSGMSQAEYVRQHQLKIHRFRYWVKKHRSSGQSDCNSSGFIALTGTIPGLQISIQYPNGVEVGLPTGTPVGYVRELILLGGRCSR